VIQFNIRLKWERDTSHVVNVRPMWERDRLTPYNCVVLVTQFKIPPEWEGDRLTRENDVVLFTRFSIRPKWERDSVTREKDVVLRMSKTLAELIDAKIAEHGGRIVKTMGDGFMAEFRNAQSAVLCAIAIQNAHLDRNRKTKDAIQLRIGIHMSDVIPSEGDVFGDGVNIAARLQEIAEPGGIAISRRVHEDIRNRLDVSFVAGGGECPADC